MRARRLRHGVVRLGLHRVDEVRKLHRVLDEEHRDVVADQVPVALVGVELDREAAHVARRVGRAALAGHGREAHEDRRALSRLGEQRRPGVALQRLVALEEAVSAGAARVHDALGNALVVEVGDLLAKDEVLEQRRPAQAGLERVLVVGDRHALVGGEHAAARVDTHAVERAGCPGSDRGAASRSCRTHSIRSACCRSPRGPSARPPCPAGGSVARSPCSASLFSLYGIAAASASTASSFALSASADLPPGLRAGPLTVERALVLEDEVLRGDLRLAMGFLTGDRKAASCQASHSRSVDRHAVQL